MAAAESSSMAARKASWPSWGFSSTVARTVAAKSASRLRRPISRLAYLLAITSPCSVRRSSPCTLPGGCARIAS